MRAGAQRGQHSAEFVVLIGTVALVTVAMQPLARHAVGMGLRAATNATLGTELDALRIAATPEVVDIDRGHNQTRLRWFVLDGSNCEASSSDDTSSWNGGRPWRSEEPELVTGLTDTTTFWIACDVAGERASFSVTVTRGSSEVDALQVLDQEGQAGMRHRTTMVDSVSGDVTGSDIRTQFVTE